MANCNDCINKTVCAIYSKNLSDVMLHNGDCKGYCEKPQKPIIRHCYNCRWCSKGGGWANCEVTYNGIYYSNKRLKALLCKHYCQKEGADNGI